MKHAKYFAWVFLLIALGSCEDFFRTNVTVNPPAYKHSIVVNMYIDDSDTTLRASVSKNIGSLENIKNKKDLLLYDAMVVIKDDQGNIVCTLDTVTPSFNEEMVNYKLKMDSAFAGNGHRFTLEVSDPRFGKATAVQTMPEKPDILHPVYREKAGIDMSGDQYGLVSFTIRDPAGEVNYYQIDIYVEMDQQAYGYEIQPVGPVYEMSFDGSLLLQDKTFNGEDFPARVRLCLYSDEETFQGKMFIEVKAITKDYYLYARSLTKAQDAQEIGFFVEPVAVYNNIHNGLGIFGLSATRVELVGKEK